MNANDGSLAHDLEMQDDYETRNYPPEGDSESPPLPLTYSTAVPLPPKATSEGGSGGPDAFSPSNQRHADKPRTDPGPAPAPGTTLTLIDQSPDGGPLSSELQDAQQGGDAWAREDFAHAAQRDFDARSPYGRHPGPESAEETGTGRELSASAYADARGRQFESGPAGGAGEDVGAF